MNGELPLWLRRAAPISVGLLLLAGLAGYAIGASKPTTTIHRAMVHSMGSISSEPTDGWTYLIPTDVAWFDANGSFHDHGRPDCLPQSGLVGPITFASVEVNVPAVIGYRAVVWVSCRS
jgi:hypothetical protein